MLIALVAQLAILMAVGALYVFLLRRSSTWALGHKVSRKLAWIWWALSLVLTLVGVVLRSVLFPGPTGIGIALGFSLHVAVGGAFFGRFSISPEGSRPGFTKGVVMVGIAASLMLAISTALFFGSTYLLSHRGA